MPPIATSHQEDQGDLVEVRIPSNTPFHPHNPTIDPWVPTLICSTSMELHRTAGEASSIGTMFPMRFVNPNGTTPWWICVRVPPVQS